MVMLWMPKVYASTLYRCTGANGEPAYVSNTVGYSDCRKLGDYGAQAHRQELASLKNVRGVVLGTRAQAEIAKTLLATVQGSVLTTAKVSERGASSLASTVISGSKLVGAAGRRAVGQIGELSLPLAKAPMDAQAPLLRRTYYYKVVRADGSLYYGDRIPALQKGDRLSRSFVEYIATCFACNLHSNVHWGSVPLDLTDYADAIRAASVEYGVDEAFIRAIIHAESAFNPRALSIKGAQGLMQLMPGTASDMGVLDAFDSGQNIRGGTRYLALLLRTFNGDEHLAAAAYNAGPAAVQKYDGVPPYDETRVYVQRVDTLRKRYEAALHPSMATARSGRSG